MAGKEIQMQLCTGLIVSTHGVNNLTNFPQHEHIEQLKNVAFAEPPQPCSFVLEVEDMAEVHGEEEDGEVHEEDRERMVRELHRGQDDNREVITLLGSGGDFRDHNNIVCCKFRIYLAPATGQFPIPTLH